MAKTARRSACDPCRARRVRCLRAPDGLGPCARCRCVGASCMTSAAKRNGRPPKQHVLGSSTLTMAVSPTTSRPSCENQALALAPPESLPLPSPPPSMWPTPGDSLFASQFSGHEHGLDDPLLFLAEPLDSYYQLPALCADQGSSSSSSSSSSSTTQTPISGMSTDVREASCFPGGGTGDSRLLPMIPPPPETSITQALAEFCEATDQRIAAADAFFADPAAILQRCRGDRALDAEDENPADLLLACSAELLAIVQRFNEASSSPETVLLVLAAYLALLRLFDALFHRIHQTVGRAPPASYRTLTVKAVLRVGGGGSGGGEVLHDMPLPAYARGVLGAIQGQMRALERCLGIPAEHCLEESKAPVTGGGGGLFARADRARLFWAAMAQEDVRPRRGRGSYVASIRASIQESIAVLEG